MRNRNARDQCAMHNEHFRRRTSPLLHDGTTIASVGDQNHDTELSHDVCRPPSPVALRTDGIALHRTQSAHAVTAHAPRPVRPGLMDAESSGTISYPSSSCRTDSPTVRRAVKSLIVTGA